MRTREDVESYLLRAGVPYEEVRDELWTVSDAASGETIVVRLAGPLVVLRVKVVELARITGRLDELFRRLLELNAEEMVHGAYGISNEAIVLTSSLRVENLDYNELQGAIDDLSLAISRHHELFARYCDAA